MTERPNCDPISQRCSCMTRQPILVILYFFACATVWHAIVAFLPGFFQRSAKISSRKILNNFNLPHKNTVKETVSVQLQLVSFDKKTKQYTMKRILVLHRIPQYCLKICINAGYFFPAGKINLS